LTNQLVQLQKERLVNKGTAALTDLINKKIKARRHHSNGVTDYQGRNKKKVKEEAKATSIINGFFFKKRKKRDRHYQLINNIFVQEKRGITIVIPFIF
jgi:hypothetical protein